MSTDMHSLLMYSLYAPTWTAYKRDKKVTEEAKKINHVDPGVDAGSFNKLVLPDMVELDKIKSYISRSREEFYLRTSPWGEQRGVRVGKAEFHMEMMEWFGERQSGLDPLKDAFAAAYPSTVARMEFTLNDMFDPNDYPPLDRVLDRFQLVLSVTPLPNVKDIRILEEIPLHVRQEIEQQITKDLEASHAATVAHAFAQLYKPIAHMASALKKYHDGESKKLYDSVVENVRLMAEMATRINVARDPRLEQFAVDAEKLVENLTTKDLKESDGARVLAAKKAQALADKIAKYLPE